MTSLPAVDPQSRAWLEAGEVQRLLLEPHPGIAMQLDADGRIDWINAAGASRLGREPGDLRGRPLDDLLLADDAGGGAGARLRQAVSSDAQGWTLRRNDGSPLAVQLAVAALRDHRGEATGLIAVEPAATADEAADIPLRLVTHDSLTGLPTHAVMADRLEMAIQHAARQHNVVGLMLVEIDGFEALCGEHGRSVGDDLLRAVASRLHFEMRKTDTAARLDGGRFAAMLVDLHEADAARLVAEKIQPTLSAPVNTGVARIPLNVRIGVAWYPSHGDQLLQLTQAADGALAAARQEQRPVACASAPTP